MAFRSNFLKDIFFLSFSAFGGPSAHIALALEHLVRRKKYLTEEELIELMALCSILPGPTSTQTITSIGYKLGGPMLGFLTLLVWVLPAIIGMTALSFGYIWLSESYNSLSIFRFVPAVAVGFVVFAAWKIGKKVIKSELTGVLFFCSGLLAILFRSPWVFPLLLIIGGLITNFLTTTTSVEKHNPPPIRWSFLGLFLAIFAGLTIAVQFSDHKFLILAESFYRFGSIIFGGGQVLIPVMQTEMVDHLGYLSNEEFLTGYGLVQGMPGPVFSFSAFVGGLAMRDGAQLMGALLGALSLFLPGTLLIFFVYPLWSFLKKYPLVQRSMLGINAVAGGFILAAVFILGKSLGTTELWLYGLTFITFLSLEWGKVPGYLLILGSIIMGLII